MHFSEEFPKLHESSVPMKMVPFPITSSRIWKMTNPGILKVNTDMAFSESKIGIGIIVRNHLGVPLITICIPIQIISLVEYGELLGIIEDHVASSLLSKPLFACRRNLRAMLFSF